MTPPKVSGIPNIDSPALRELLARPTISPEARAALDQTKRPTSTLGEIGGLGLSSAPRIPRTAEGSIPLERDAIGKALREGRARLERRLAGGSGHRGPEGTMPYAARLHRHVPQAPRPLRVPNGHRPHQFHATATTGRRPVNQTNPRPSVSMTYGLDRSGMRNPVVVQEFATRDDLRAALRRGDVPHRGIVAFNNASGQRVEVQVLINYQTRKAHLVSVR